MTEANTEPGRGAAVPWQSIVLLALGLLGTSCFPAKFSGYRPSGPGRLQTGYCVSGVRDALRIEGPHGVEIVTRATRDEEHQLLLAVDISVPGGVVLEPGAPDLLLESPGWREPRLLRIREITAPGPLRFQPGEPLPGATGRVFSLWFAGGARGGLWQTGIVAASEFTLTLPSMTVRSTTFTPGPVNFHWYSEWGLATCVQ